jgi:hypothetical protein
MTGTIGKTSLQAKAQYLPDGANASDKQVLTLSTKVTASKKGAPGWPVSLAPRQGAHSFL